MSLDINKEYASTLGHQFTMKNKADSCIRKNESFMHIAVNFLCAQVTEHSQMSANAGIKKFGDRALAAVVNEYKQLNEGVMPGKPVFGRINHGDTTIEERKRALEAVNLIKKKRCGKIKGRTCADGSKQNGI